MVLSEKQAYWQYHLVAYGRQALTAHEKNYHSTKLEFLLLKWAITEHFKEYLLYWPFLVKTGNNPLTYIMTTPNLDATGHQWVGALARFIFQLEYQKGWDNTIVDALSQITTRLGPKVVQSILDGVALGSAHRAEGYVLAVVEGDHNIEREVHVATEQVEVKMHVTNWATAQREDPIINGMMNWLGMQKTDLRTLLGEHAFSKEGQMVWRNCQNFMTPEHPLSMLHTQRGE